MAQLSNVGRKTKVIRTPKKYEFLVKSFAVWLSTHPNQATLWECEEYLQQQHEESTYKAKSHPWKREISKAMKIVLAELK